MNRSSLLVLAIFIAALLLAYSRTPSNSQSEWTPQPLKAPDDEWFQEHVGSASTPVLLDFSARWCGPCKAMKPSLEKLEKAYGGRLRIVEIDIDERPQLAQHFEVGSIPHLMLLKDNQIVNNDVGGRSYYDLVKFVEGACGKP